jgi:hypothetical protein
MNVKCFITLILGVKTFFDIIYVIFNIFLMTFQGRNYEKSFMTLSTDVTIFETIFLFLLTLGQSYQKCW